jgi:hypothetical protein
MSGVLTRPRRERGQVASTRDRDDVLALGYANSSRLTAKACPVGGATENLNVHHFDANPSDSALATAPLRADQAGFTTRSPKDDDRGLGGRLLLLGKQHCWRTAWRARSLLSRTNLSSGRHEACESRWLLLSTDAGVSTRTQLTATRDDLHKSMAALSGHLLSP